ncbi:MAG: GIY-YIG nuclease family protein [Rhodospirillales bacterium]|nr:GIY-YIG nuclease family protein [Rhodospirillales bacterium]
MQKKGYIYILSNKKDGTLYIGITTSLRHRIYQHKHKLQEGFTKKYNLTKLVYFEEYDSYAQAIRREKRLKEWRRQWKLDLINKRNPQWRGLYEDINN